MRHRKASRKLRGTPCHARAMYSNMLVSLIQHGRIKTTQRRARTLRSIAEKLVTRATSLGDLLLKDKSRLQTEDKARLIHAMRLVRRELKQRDAVAHLFDEIAPRYLGRPGGYTRIYRYGFRKGDNAPMVLLEFIEAEMPEKEGSAGKEEPDKKKGRLASLLSRKKKASAKDKAEAPKKKQAKKEEEE